MKTKLWLAITAMALTALAARSQQPPETNIFIPKGAVWKYLDNGSDQGTAWKELLFKDASWASGPAQLGYDNGETTPVGYGPDINNKYITTYFRSAFSLADRSRYTNLVVRLLRDDGGVVYLNGVEVYRSNMPLNVPINYLTLASTNVSPADETNNFYAQTVSPSLLLNGQNVVAVEIHQVLPTSSDLSFNLELRAVGVPTSGPPAIVTQPLSQRVIVGSNVTLSVLVGGQLPLNYQWYLNGTNLAAPNSPTLSFPNVQFTDAGNYTVVISNALGSVTSGIAGLVVRPPPAFDLARDFSTAENPNGPWTFGYETSLRDVFVPFTLFRQVSDLAGALIDVWANRSTGPSQVNRNGSAITGSSDGGQGTYPPGTVWLLPGVEGLADNFGVIRFTLPPGQSGSYELIVPVQPYLAGSLSGDTDFHLLKNGADLFVQYLPANAASVTFSNVLALTDGDTLDFAVGRGGDGHVAGSGIKIRVGITLNSTNPQSPAILAQPQGVSAPVGTNVLFSVAAGSTAPLNYQWFLNDVPIGGATAPTLPLTAVQPADAGDYTVTVFNSLGTVKSSKATLVVVAPSTYDLGRDFSGTSNPSGVWSYGYESVLGTGWLRLPFGKATNGVNGVPLEVWEKLATAEPVSIYYNPTPLASTCCGSAGVFPPGTVWVLPGTDTHTDNYGVIRFTVPSGGGGTYQLATAARSYQDGASAGDSDFHLLKNGVEIFGQVVAGGASTGYTNQLTLGPGDTLDFAVGRGADGRSLNSGLKVAATLDFISTDPVPPTIIAQPRSLRVAVGSNVTFSVAASGTPPFRYQWNGSSGKISGATNATLTLNGVGLGDSGNYQVIVSNDSGGDASTPAVLTVVDLGTGLFDRFDPDIDNLQWSAFGSFGTYLATNYGGSVSPNNSLWFGGSGTRQAITRTLNTTLGGTIAFFLHMADGNSAPWERTSLPTFGIALEYSLNQGSTWINIVSYNTVLLTNWTVEVVDIPAGARAASTLFRWRQLATGSSCCDHWALDDTRIVIGPSPPIIVMPPPTRAVLVGSSNMLSVAVIGTGPFSYLWTLNGVPIPNATNANLILPSASTNDAGNYVVKVNGALGSAVSSIGTLTVVGLGDDFQITSLTSNGVVTIEHNNITGSYRGGIAASSNKVFYTGYNGTGRFALDDLAGGANLGVIYDSLVSNLRTETVYILGGTGTNIIGYGGGTVTSLLELDATTGALTGNRITLSSPINVGYSSGLFSGYDKIVFHTGSRAYEVLLPSGLVVDLGPMSSLSHNYSGSWAYWGLAEYHDGSVFLVYVRDYQTIVRTRVPDGLTVPLANFSNLSSEMGSITVSIYENRWYFQHPYDSQFRQGGNETLGFADATFLFNPPQIAPRLVRPPKDQLGIVGGTAVFKALATGAAPLTYQWTFSGVDIAGATNADLTLQNLTTNQAGAYSVTVSNALGQVTSTNATLNVVGMGPDFQITSLSSNGAVVIEHVDVTGSDGGGIATSAEQVFYTGSAATARFRLEDLSGGTGLGGIYYGLVGNLRTETVYSLGNGTNIVGYNGGAINSLLELDPNSGALTGNRIDFSTTITVSGYSAGVFSGYDRVAFHTGSHVYQVLLPSGLVVDMGSMTNVLHNYSSSWAYWGVAEFHEGALHLVYARDNRTIARTRVPDGLTVPVATFNDLSYEMSSITVSVYQNRWYFHHPYDSQFRRGGDQTLGFADATFTYADAPRPVTILGQPVSQSVSAGSTVNLMVGAIGTRPLSYQWKVNGKPIADATNSTLTLSAVTTSQAGSYSVLVSNGFSSAPSSNAVLAVSVLTGAPFQITALSTNGSRAIEEQPIAGYERSGLAVSSAEVFLTGSSGTARFGLADLSGGANSGSYYDALVSNLRTETVYSLANGTNLIPYGGGTVTALMEHDSLTGALTGNRIDLSASISFVGSSGSVGLFAGYDRIVLHNGARIYNVSLPSGQVTELGTLPQFSHNSSSPWAYSGVAEFANGVVSLVYVRDYRTIVRTRVPDGLTTVVGAFFNLSDMSVFTVSIYLNRWYFHHSYSSQFRASGNETLGYADAAFTFNDGPRPLAFVGQPLTQSAPLGGTVNLRALAKGTGPISYQWQLNNTDIPNATNAALTLDALTQGQAGTYAVRATSPLGSLTSAPATLSLFVITGEPFQIATLSTNNVSVIEHYDVTGYDRSALAASSAQVFYSGSSATARFNLIDLSGGTSLGTIYDGLVSNLKTETVYSLGNGTNPIANGGGTITTLLELDPATGVRTGNSIALTTPIVASNVTYNGSVGIFAGWDRIVLHTGSRVYNISLPSGEVQDLGGMDEPAHTTTQSWAYWGLAEFHDGLVYLVYVRDSQTIVRTRVPDGLTTTVAAFNDLGSMATITAAPYLGRWYFHHLYSSQFRSSGTETLGFADAAFVFNDVARPPAIAGQPLSQTVFEEQSVTLGVSATGSRPLFYQWQWNGAPIPGATNAIFVIESVSANQAGDYIALVSNSAGSVTSRVATLVVKLALPVTENFRITGLLTNNSQVVDHEAITGDDRGGIAVSSTHVFYTGDNYTGRFLAADLSGGTNLNRQYDALTGNLRTETVYSLGNGTNVISYGGGTVTTLLEIDGNTGALTANRITLSTPIIMGSGSGIFAGYDRVVLHNGSRAYAIELPSGQVVDLGAMSTPTHYTCESWAYWGVAEQFDGSIYIDCVRDSATITRTRVPDGATTVLGAFNYLSDMCSFTFSISRSRWYFHHEYSSQFGGLNETVGFADATWGNPPNLSSFPAEVTFEDTATPAIPFRIADGQTAVDGLVLSGHSSDTNFLPDSSFLFSGSGSNRFVTILPAHNRNGSATVTITVTDTAGASANRSFVLNVLAVNDPPAFTIGSEHVTLEDGGPQTALHWATNIVAGGSDESSQLLTFTLTNNNNSLFAVQPAIDPNGTLTYTPAPDANGSALVTAVLHDDGGTTNGGQDTSSAATFTISILPVNDPPSFAKGPDQLVLEDCGPQAVAQWATAISAGPTNESAQALQFLVSNDQTNLFLVQPAIDAGGTLRYTPATNANGLVHVAVQLRDDGGIANGGANTSPTQFFTITITPVNDAPVAYSQSVTVNEDTTVGITLGGFDADGDPLRFTVNPPAHGGLTGTAPHLSYRPAANYHGPDSFTFTVNDGQVDSSAATVTINVISVNDPPVAVARVYSPSVLSTNATNYVLLAVDSTQAVATLSGLLSSDPDQDPLQFSWFEAGHATPFASLMFAVVRLKVGTHLITLQVSDGIDTSRATVGIQVLTPGMAVASILQMVESSGLAKKDTHPLEDPLNHSITAFNRGKLKEGTDHLDEFRKKLRDHHFANAHPALAHAWDLAVQNLLNALGVKPRPESKPW